MSQFVSDLGYGMRGLVARPLFALVAVLSLGLGIGVNTAIYSLYHQVVMRELPAPEPDRLVNLSAPGIKRGDTSNNGAGPREDIFSYAMFRDLEREQTPFTGIAAHRSIPVNVAAGRSTQTGSAMLVSGGYFGVLRLAPARGRLIQPADDANVGGAAVAVLSHAYWRNELGADPAVIGRVLRVNGQPFEVVGVAPEGFAGTTFGTRPLLFVPITQRWSLQPQASRDHDSRTSYWVYLFARLRPGVDLAQAEREINLPYARILEAVELPLNTGMSSVEQSQFLAKRVTLAPGARGQSSAAGSAGRPLALLLAAAALVLVVACLNIANLLLARGAARAGELAVRASIGASRARLVAQLGAEALLLAAAGGLLSLPLASLALLLLGSMIPFSGSGAFSLALDAVAMQFAALVALGTVLLFGVFPAAQVARIEPGQVLRSESARSGGSRAAAHFRAALAVAQVAFSMSSLVLAGLFLQSLSNLGRVDLGMRIDALVSFNVSPERNGYTPERSAQVFSAIEEALRALPGVASASGSMVPLLSNNEWGTNISLRGHEDASPDLMSLSYNRVGTDFFDTVALPLLAGRRFTDADRAGAPKVAIVNRAFVEHFGLQGDPIGQRMAFGDQDELDVEIVGLVEDAKYSDVRQEDPPQFFAPWAQAGFLGSLHFYVRSELDPAVLLPQIESAVRRIDPDLPVEDLGRVSDQVAESLSMDRFVGRLAAGFAVLATLLAALGLYGLLSYTLSQRLRELGLRLALGAAPPRLRAMVLGQVGRLVLCGGALGMGGALVLGRMAQSLLFGLEGHDPATLAGASLVLGAVALAAGWMPARRASRIDPMIALRHD